MFRDLTLLFATALALTFCPAYAADNSWANEVGDGYGLASTDAIEKPSKPEAPDKVTTSAAMADWMETVGERMSSTKPPLPDTCRSDECHVDTLPVLRVDILNDGSISKLRLKKSSGNQKIDAAAFDFVRSLAPFPPLPSNDGGHAGMQFEVIVPFP
ncbi:MAG: cell envelope integrity protein TolA [Parvibaculum sp.]|nr:cell envelope integrity protein TolA [Parvibaculum sp.]